MEIPYTVQPRPDTGLPNPKVGIWLFLASEVMLFGGLFSAYIFLRVGADYPWPFHDLVVWPGFLNTFVLIASSVTVVMAWASLKMRKFRAFQGYMIFTILCALTFMGLKSFEYYGKFTHYGITLKDGSIIEGHVGHDAQGSQIVFGDVKSIYFDLQHSTVDCLDFLVEKNKDKKPHDGKHAYEHLHDHAVKVKFTDLLGKVQTTELTKHVLGELKTDWWERKVAHNAQIRAALAAGKEAKEAGVAPTSILRMDIEGEPLLLAFDERDRLSHTASEVVFKDQTKLEGKLITDAIEFIPDNIDLRRVVDPEKSLAWNYLPDFKQHWFKNLEEERAARATEFRPADDPDVTRYSHRLELVNYNLFHSVTGERFGPIPTLEVKREDKTFFSNFTPRYNPYYAIYFTMTGLHGLHVIGGAIVLAYFLFTSRKMWATNPQQLINRVEVGGLFWHFVDLVWIFLFPLYYLM